MKRTLQVAGSKRRWGIALGGLIIALAFLSRPAEAPQLPSSNDLGKMNSPPAGKISDSDRVTYYDPSTYSVGKDDG